METKETMGKRISSLRKKKGMTQEQLAQMVGVTAQAVSKWENDLSCPDISLLPTLAQALGITTDELLGCAPERTVSFPRVKAEEEEDKSKYSVTVKMNRADKVIFALLLVGLGVVFLLNALGFIPLGQGITFWSVLWPFLLVCLGIVACREELNPVSLGIGLLGLYLLLYNIGLIPAQYKLTWAMVWPVALILIGVTALIHFVWPNYKKSKNNGNSIFHVEKGDPVFTCTEEGGFINIDSAFSSQTKRIEGAELIKGAEVDMAFGNLTLDLSAAEIENGARFDADVSFGAFTLVLPAGVNVKLESETAFGGINCPPEDPNALICVYLKGEVSFGKIEVERA